MSFGPAHGFRLDFNSTQEGNDWILFFFFPTGLELGLHATCQCILCFHLENNRKLLRAYQQDLEKQKANQLYI